VLHSRSQESGDQRVRRGGRRAELRHEQGGDEAPPAGKLENPSLAILVRADHPQATVVQKPLMLRVESEVAVVLLHCLGPFVESRGPRTARQPDLHPLAGERAGELGDEQLRTVGVVLGVLSVLEPEHVTGVLEDHVLEAAAGAQERHVFFTAKHMA
jgi:hypothetical protein